MDPGEEAGRARDDHGVAAGLARDVVETLQLAEALRGLVRDRHGLRIGFVELDRRAARVAHAAVLAVDRVSVSDVELALHASIHAVGGDGRVLGGDLGAAVDEFIAPRADRCTQRLVAERLPAHHDHAVRGAREHAAAVARSVGGELGGRHARREIERAPVVRDRLERIAPARTHGHERLVRAHPVGRHELVLHDPLRTEHIALEPALACAGERAILRRAVPIDRRARPHRVLVHLDGAELVAEDHPAEPAVADGQGLGPACRGLRVPERQVARLGACGGRRQRGGEELAAGESRGEDLEREESDHGRGQWNAHRGADGTGDGVPDGADNHRCRRETRQLPQRRAVRR